MRRFGWLLIAGSIAAALGIVLTVMLVLWEARSDAWARAEISESNLARAFATHLERHLQLYEAGLDFVVLQLDDGLLAAGPGPRLDRLLSNVAASMEFEGSILVLDQQGRVIGDSATGPKNIDLSDRDYFRVHVEDAALGIYLSQPFQSRLRHGDWSVALSQRLNRPDGGFGGVVAVVISLDFVREFMRIIHMQTGDVMTLLNTSARVLVRQPPMRDEEKLSLLGSTVFERMMAERTGSVVGTSMVDGVERLYSFTPVSRTDLVVAVGASTAEILAAWRWRSLVIGSMAGLIGTLLVGLALLLRGSLRRQGIAERELKRLATTDPLTGLANRRRFDEVLEIEWLRARADRTPLTVMMVDADHFKQLNDRYGHAAGDAMLRTMAGLILRAGHEMQRDAQDARRPDARERHILAARIGGDEFAVIAPRCNRAEGETLAWAIRELIREATAAEGDDAPPCSVSVGVATDMGGESATATALLAAADAAVYAAKAAGRDRVAGAVHTASDALRASRVALMGHGPRPASPPHAAPEHRPHEDPVPGEATSREPPAGSPGPAIS